MKKCSLTLVLLAILPLGVSQCSSAYRLVDYKEYCAKDDLDAHTTYQYENGVLYSKTEVLTRMKDIVDSTVTYYDVIKSVNSIDSIEISYEYRNGVLDEVSKVVKNCNPEGIIQKQTEFELQDDDWQERGCTLYGCTLYDSKGRWIEYVIPGRYHSWSTYDSLDRQIGIRYMHIFSNNDPIFVDTVEFASDGLTATQTHYTIFQDDKRHVNSKKSYRLDDKGRVILKENAPLDNDSTFCPHKTVYQYDRRGRVKTEKIFKSYENTLYWSFKHKYWFGLRTRTIEYDYTDGKKYIITFTVFKYDFRHRLLLEKTDYDGRLRRDFDERKIWTYEKAK